MSRVDCASMLSKSRSTVLAPCGCNLRRITQQLRHLRDMQREFVPNLLRGSVLTKIVIAAWQR